MAQQASCPPFRRRLLALSGYLGFAPWLGLIRTAREDSFLRHHRAQAAVVLLFLGPFLGLVCAWLLLITEIFTQETWLFDFELQDITKSVLRGFSLTLVALAAGWVLIWAIASTLALAGSERRAPFVRGTTSRWVRWLAHVWSGLLGLTVAFLLVFGQHTSRLARAGGDPAAVYFLFDPRGFEVFGRWGPKMIFAPISRRATVRWGRGSVIVAPVDRQTLRQALAHGRFVVLFVHGTVGRIVTSGGLTIEPYRARNRQPHRGLSIADHRLEVSEDAPAGANLQFLYVTGCRTGAQGLGGQWQQAFAPTEVVTFDRMTGGLEHIRWLWTEAPEKLAAIR